MLADKFLLTFRIYRSNDIELRAKPKFSHKN